MGLSRDRLRQCFFGSWQAMTLNFLVHRRFGHSLYVLMFHQVNDRGSPFYPAVPVRAFKKICRFLARNMEVIGFSEVDAHFSRSKPGGPAAIITFDDGHDDIIERAFPILREHGLKFNVNVVTGTLETGLPNDHVRAYDILNSTSRTDYTLSLFQQAPVTIAIDRASPAKTEAQLRRCLRPLTNEQRRAVVQDMERVLADTPVGYSRMLSASDVRFLSDNGAEIGAHTHTHPILTGLSPDEVDAELRRPKQILEELCGRRVDIFAYPQGRATSALIERTFGHGYRHILLTNDRRNTMPLSPVGVYQRIGLYHRSAEENLARLFGFHAALGRFT